MLKTEWLEVKEVAPRVGVTDRAIRNYIKKHGAERDGNGVPFIGDMERNGKLVVGLSESFAVFLVERYGKVEGERNVQGMERGGIVERLGHGRGDNRSVEGVGARPSDAGRVLTFSGAASGGDVANSEQRRNTVGHDGTGIAGVSGAAELVGELRARIAELTATIEHERREKAEVFRLLDQQQKLTLASETRQISATDNDSEKKTWFLVAAMG